MKWLWALILVFFGWLGAFILVFNLFFTDGPSNKLHPEYLVGYAMLIAYYGLIMWGARRWGPLGQWTPAWLAWPALIFIVLYQEPTWMLRLLVTLAVTAGLAGGTWLARSQASSV